MMDIEHLIRQISKVKQIKEKDKTRAKEDLKMPTDFECFVCGTKFMTNEERKHHLEKGTHGHLCDTASPQEQEEVRSSEDG
ncbi:MAG: hypothetical protein ACRD4J_01535 [Nitrososphaeraceae archaeon]